MTVRRLKNYTGQSGYVYQYYFVGKRQVEDGTEGWATEYVFDASVDRHTYWPVSILIQQAAVSDWGAENGRELSEAEQYAVGKMALFEAFDEIESLAESGRRFVVRAEKIGKLVDSLNLE